MERLLVLAIGGIILIILVVFLLNLITAHHG